MNRIVYGNNLKVLQHVRTVKVRISNSSTDVGVFQKYPVNILGF
jgi:hypothetical protein